MLEHLSRQQNIRTFSISPENFTGKKAAAPGPPPAPAPRLPGAGERVESLPVGDHSRRGNVYPSRCHRAGGHPPYLDDRQRPPGTAADFAPLLGRPPDPLGGSTPGIASATYQEFRQISSLAVCVNPGRGLNCYWPMPYRTGFRMEIENLSPTTDITVYYQIDCEEKAVPDDALYFHAQFRRTNPTLSSVHTLLDGVTGRGQYVGTYLCWGVHNNGWWGEGEIKFYLDDDTDFPTVCGTGTEDYFCGAYNFDVNGRYTEFTTPYSGLSKVDTTDGCYQSQRRFHMYRWHIQDPILFYPKPESHHSGPGMAQ